MWGFFDLGVFWVLSVGCVCQAGSCIASKVFSLFISGHYALYCGVAPLLLGVENHHYYNSV